jgi:hypothetical protein
MINVPDTIEELCFLAGQKLDINDCKLYTKKGVHIDDIQLVRYESIFVLCTDKTSSVTNLSLKTLFRI